MGPTPVATIARATMQRRRSAAVRNRAPADSTAQRRVSAEASDSGRGQPGRGGVLLALPGLYPFSAVYPERCRVQYAAQRQRKGGAQVRLPLPQLLDPAPKHKRCLASRWLAVLEAAVVHGSVLPVERVPHPQPRASLRHREH